MPGAQAQPRGRTAASQLPSSLFPFFPGKISTFNASTELEISLLLHTKGNQSYNGVSVVEGIRSKKSLMQGTAEQPAVFQQGTGFTVLLRLDVKTQQDSLGERRDGPG